MDEYKSPEDILDEIMNRAPASEPQSASAFPPASDPAGEPPPPTSPTEPKAAEQPTAASSLAAKTLPWLCVALAVGVLALAAVCLLTLNTRIRALETSMEGVRLMDSLREENEALTRDDKVLRQDKENLQKELQQTYYLLRDTSQQLQDIQSNLYYEIDYARAQKAQSQYLWFMEQFMDDGDYPMAALIAVQGGYNLEGVVNQIYIPDGVNASYPELSSVQREQYDKFLQILLDAGLIEERIDLTQLPLDSRSSTTLSFAEQWDPVQNEDMAALYLFWHMLDAYYDDGNHYGPVQWLLEYEQFDFPDSRENSLSQRIRRAAGPYAVRLYEQMLYELVADGFLIETEDGYEIGWSDNVNYILPFEDPDANGARDG